MMNLDEAAELLQRLDGASEEAAAAIMNATFGKLMVRLSRYPAEEVRRAMLELLEEGAASLQ
jgi:hypothetical protein